MSNSLPTALLEGYRHFRESTFRVYQERFEVLAEEGQAPRAMLIGCCDSRAEPSIIFSAKPGELFTVRNVANLVPPHTPSMSHHGTSAAIEFAVRSLRVPAIVVMGHAQCGGIRALLDAAFDERGSGEFIPQWMDIARPVRDAVLREHPDADAAERQRLVEQASIRNSLDNLRGFPFVAEAEAAGRLTLHGLYFDIGQATLSAWDSDTGAFAMVA